MSAVITDQFRILNASNFVSSVLDTSNSYYAFLGLSNPTSVGFGRTTTWDTENNGSAPNPVDNFQYLAHYRDTSLFGKRITSENVRRVIRKVEWTSNTAYDEYRHNYGPNNQTPNSQSLRLYDSNYYVINKDFRVYICIDNGSSVSDLTGGRSNFEPTSTDLAPFSAGNDGYRWKYLFTISPSDIVKFDSSEYIVLPNNWETSTDPEISRVRDGANNGNNQIQKVYIADGGSGYTTGTYPILGDGSGAEVTITAETVNGVDGVITSAVVATNSGGTGYTWGMVDFGRTTIPDPAKLIPIIPPSEGHGHNIYEELGADRVLIYARFDDSTRDFPTDTKFAQVGLIKDPQQYSSSSKYTGSTYSSLYALKLQDGYDPGPGKQIEIGEEIYQDQTEGSVSYRARGYVASYDATTKVLKYYQDRSLFYDNGVDQTDSSNLNIPFTSTTKEIRTFNNAGNVTFTSSTSASATVNSGFNGSSSNGVNLGVTFASGLATPEINKKTGDIIYIDSRPVVQRNIRQKEDIKIILEF